MARIFSHRRHEQPDGAHVYELLVHVDEWHWLTARCDQCGAYLETAPGSCPVCGGSDFEKVREPHPEAVRAFQWGPIPIVPETGDLSAAQDAYAEIHDRPLVVGEPFVTEEEYVALQVFEAMAAIKAEVAARAPEKGKKLDGEGLEF